MKPKNLFRVFQPVEDDLSKPRGYVLLEVDEEGIPEDIMRIAVHGAEPITVKFTGADIFLAPELKDFRFIYEILPAAIRTRDNMVSTEWIDVRDGILKQDIKVETQEERGPEEFIKTLEDLQKENYKQGAVLRWAVHATTPSSLALILQALPASITHIKTRAQFKMDNCPAITLATVDLTCRFQRGAGVKGPAPILFSPQPEEAENKLNSNPATALAGREITK